MFQSHLQSFIYELFTEKCCSCMCLNQSNAFARPTHSPTRLKSHLLRIETGRHGQNRIDRSERICQVCDTGDLEDEYHFVLACAAYNELRVKYINMHFRHNPSVFKFLQLMNSSDTTTINNLSYFIYNAFKMRTSRLQNA